MRIKLSDHFHFSFRRTSDGCNSGGVKFQSEIPGYLQLIRILPTERRTDTMVTVYSIPSIVGMRVYPLPCGRIGGEPGYDYAIKIRFNRHP